MTQPIEVEYELTLDDYLAFQRYDLLHTNQLQRSRRNGTIRFFVLIAICNTAIYFWYGQPEFGFWVTWLIGAPFLLAGIYYYLCPIWTMRSIRRFLQESHKEDRKAYTPRRFIMDARGVCKIMEDAKEEVNWSGIERIVETEEHAFFYTRLMMAMIIPRRVFFDREQFHAFVEQAKRLQWEAGTRDDRRPD